MIFLPRPPKCWDYRNVPSTPDYYYRQQQHHYVLLVIVLSILSPLSLLLVISCESYVLSGPKKMKGLMASDLERLQLF